MRKAFVLVTCLPPTRGHLNLIEFASNFADRTEVILCTQPSEPWHWERAQALSRAMSRLPRAGTIHFNRIHKELPQEPEDAPGFWDMWAEFLRMFDFQPFDYVVASEPYGKELAEHVGGEFIPYDIERQLYDCKATRVRENLWNNFPDLLPEFQSVVRPVVTVFGAESTGKTTLSRDLAYHLNGKWVYEYARPYLEATDPHLDSAKMTNIWQGQRAVQEQALNSTQDHRFIIQDTDLFSTVGYWNMSIWAKQFNQRAPQFLVKDAMVLQSDLYIVCPSNIPFEHDQLRYGGDEREIADEKWIDLLDSYGLPYVVLTGKDAAFRLGEAADACMKIFNERADKLNYHRRGKEYGISF